MTLRMWRTRAVAQCMQRVCEIHVTAADTLEIRVGATVEITPFVNGWMDGWMDGRTDGWTDGRTDGWPDGWLGVCMNG